MNSTSWIWNYRINEQYNIYLFLWSHCEIMHYLSINYFIMYVLNWHDKHTFLAKLYYQVYILVLLTHFNYEVRVIFLLLNVCLFKCFYTLYLKHYVFHMIRTDDLLTPSQKKRELMIKCYGLKVSHSAM